jgi:hypothetical protein
MQNSVKNTECFNYATLERVKSHNLYHFIKFLYNSVSLTKRIDMLTGYNIIMFSF